VKEILPIFAMAIILVSCQKENNSPSDLITSRNFGSVFGITDYEEAKRTIGDYAIFGILTNGGVRARVATYVQSIPQIEEMNAPALTVSFMPDKSQRTNRTDAGDFFINGMKWEFQEQEGKYWSNELTMSTFEEYVLNLFGQEVSISLQRDGQTIVSTSFRAPDRLTQFDIPNTPFVAPPSEVRWLSTNNVNISWNADPLNENGLLLVLTSQGDKLYEIKGGIKEWHYMAAFIQEDDGEYTIPNALFDNLEKNQRIRLTLYRGKFDYIEDDGYGYDYKFYALSEISDDFAIQ
jgi:hypothetical protein